MDTQKKLNNPDSTFKYKLSLKPGGESAKLCFSCGVCTASCPVNEANPAFNPRAMIKNILLGNKKELLSSGLIWYCILCERCFANCPQNVNFAHIARALRDIAIEEKFIDQKMLDKISEIDSSIHSLRKNVIDELLKKQGSIQSQKVDQLLKKIINK